eukprot:SAG31_NODE_4655_length_3066_cov_2.019211_2_plen_166_part_00
MSWEQGAFASRTLSEGEFIGEYVGEIILTKDAETEERRGSAYIFDLGDGLSIDARPMGNKTRRMVSAAHTHTHTRTHDRETDMESRQSNKDKHPHRHADKKLIDNHGGKDGQRQIMSCHLSFVASICNRPLSDLTLYSSLLRRLHTYSYTRRITAQRVGMFWRSG